ncbi:hypothetical protein KVR01_013074 [Diaporthe batatas]|uniref:uncharacterized protein n=1 Tax=Diaporthe batatas TaxID=748121 RepID=UPI001D04DC1D|nr:uncharacterized protein KVR01_013074 [Diaporthe batatas]KAG8157084.1 hypothetical protein KVR01_013074 [Diaporthe batatas]
MTILPAGALVGGSMKSGSTPAGGEKHPTGIRTPKMSTIPRNRRRPIPRRDSRQEELDDAKKVTSDYISELRKGRVAGWDVKKREAIIRGIVLPRQGRWRGLQDPHVANPRRPPRVQRKKFRFANNIPSSPGLLPPRAYARLQSAINTAFRLERNFTPAHVTFRKLLGYGGYGVAALFGLHDSTGRETRVVVKADIRSSTRNGTIQVEKENMTLMSGAKHVVQRTLLARFPWPKSVPERYDYVGALGRVIIKLVIVVAKVVTLALLALIQAVLFLAEAVLGLKVTMIRVDDDQGAQDSPERDSPDNPSNGPAFSQPNQTAGPLNSLASWKWSKLWPDWPAGPEQRAVGIDDAIRQNRQELDSRQDVICMEYLRFGDLSKWIAKMARQNDRDGESIFPEEVAWAIFECLWRGCVALAHPKGFYQGKDPLTTQIPPMTESSDGSAVDASDPLVHFDLDPQNIFVGDFAPDHALWPLTKIGDLGLSLQPKYQIFQDRIDEEHQQWRLRTRGKLDSYLPEQITEEWDFIPGLNALRSHEVAGNYGAHSNLYHIGLTMFELITLSLPDDPPFARPYEFVIDRQSLSGWTYGHNLLGAYNPEISRRYSADLRHTIAWCMEHNPLDRPSLVRLGQIIQKHRAADSLEQPAEATRKLVGDLLRVPLTSRAR